MDYKYRYRFIIEYSAPCDRVERIYSAFFVYRNTPIDSRLYYKVRRKAFGAMNEKYWSVDVNVYRAIDSDAIDTLDELAAGWKFVGNFYFIKCASTTCFSAHQVTTRGIISKDGSLLSSCWNWKHHEELYDWANHTKYNPSMRT